MNDQLQGDGSRENEYYGIYRDGVITLGANVAWPDGTAVTVRVAEKQDHLAMGKVIIAGFGLAGRWVADIFDRHGIEYVVVEKNPATVECQRRLGRTIIEGDISCEETLQAAGISDASTLALTIPDEEAVLKATRLAREIKPGIYIVARTLYASSGMQASQLGADEVVKAEQVVARQFYEMLIRKIGETEAESAAG
jgi:CPA2 family monovalent cation:H+ antiporter-2